MSNNKNIAGDFHAGHEKLRLELEEHIKTVESKMRPLPLVLNTETRCVHKVLTTFDEAGFKREPNAAGNTRWASLDFARGLRARGLRNAGLATSYSRE